MSATGSRIPPSTHWEQLGQDYPPQHSNFLNFHYSTIKFYVYKMNKTILCKGETSNVCRPRTWQPQLRINQNMMALLLSLPLTARSPRVPDLPGCTNSCAGNFIFLENISFHFIFSKPQTLHSHHLLYSLLPLPATSQGVLIRWNVGVTDRRRTDTHVTDRL